MAFFGLLQGACRVWRQLEMISYGFWFFSPYDWALIRLVSGPSPLELMLDDVMPCSIVHFMCVFFVIQTCVLQNMKTPKFVELVSYKP